MVKFQNFSPKPWQMKKWERNNKNSQLEDWRTGEITFQRWSGKSTYVGLLYVSPATRMCRSVYGDRFFFITQCFLRIQGLFFLEVFETFKLGWNLHSDKRIYGHYKTRLLNWIQILSNEVNKKLLLQLYKSLIRSHLDYSAPVYGLVNKSVLSLLDTIQTYALRLVFSAFCSSPKLNLCAEATDPPLLYRRMILTSKFMSTVSQFLHLPIYNSILLSVSNHLSIPSNKHIRLLFWTFSQQTLQSCPPLQHIYLSFPHWTLRQPTIRFDLMKIPLVNNTSYIRHIKCLLDGYPNHTDQFF